MNRGGWLMPYRASEGAPPSSPQGYRAAEARKNAGRPRRISGDLKRGGEDMTNTDIDGAVGIRRKAHAKQRSEEHTSELQSLMRISYAVFCLKKKKKYKHKQLHTQKISTTVNSTQPDTPTKVL